MSKIEFYHKILKMWMAAGHNFKDATSLLGGTDNTSQRYASLFRKHANKTTKELEKMYPELII